ncbi:MAG: DUF2752 domain-containing protein [Bacteroidales bacterium]|nr:DUF2752 domain-containing protein [Bacteroidales bacterium]
MTRIHPTLIFIRRHLEAFIWIAALVALAFTSPVDSCYSICPLHNLGISWCPGCGLGHSISWLFRGDLLQSFNAHPLGIPAVLIIAFRVISIFRKNHKYKHYSHNKSIQHG